MFRRLRDLPLWMSGKLRTSLSGRRGCISRRNRHCSITPLHKNCSVLSNILVAALYEFAPLEDFEALRDPLKQFCIERDVRGSFLLASEGINGTICGPERILDPACGFCSAM